MSYIDERVEKLKKGTFDEYAYGKSGCITPIWEYTLGLDRILGNYPKLRSSMFIYYERLFDNRSVLSFRMPNVDAHLIFKTYARMRCGKEKRVISIISMQGEEAWVLLNLIARTVIPLFRDLDEYYEFKERNFSDACIVDVRSKKSKRRVFSYEDVFPMEQGMTMKPVGNKK